MTTLSLCIIVKDEEKHLEHCLSSVRDLVNEMVVVDSGSTDKTKEIARKFGANVIDYAWEDDFSKARNVSLQHATCDWILCLDADEALSQEGCNAIRTLVTENAGKLVGFQLQQRNYTNDSKLAGWKPIAEGIPEARGSEGFFDSPLTRVFPRAKGIAFSFPIHEDVSPSILQAGGTIVCTDIVMHHYGHLKGEEFGKEKRKQYLSICEQEVLENPNSAKAHFDLGRMCREKKELDRAQECFETSVQCDPNFSRSHAALGEVLMEKKEYAAARESLQKAIATGFNAEQVYSNLGIVEAKLGDNTAAMEAFQNALEKNPQSARAYHNMGTLLLSQHRYGEAIKLFEFAYRGTGLGKFKVLSEDIAKKFDAHIQGLEEKNAAQFSPMMALKIAELYMKAARKEEAIRVLEDAVSKTEKKTPFMVNLYLNLAQLYGEEGREKAKALLQEALSWNLPGSDIVQQALDVINEKK